jgi:hypothetical protein
MSQDPERFRETLGAPDRLDTRLGALTFADGVPSDETAERVYDHLDFLHGVNVYLNSFAGASTYAIRNGFHEVGVEDNSVLLFSELLGSESVFLTANADTVYFLGFIDLTSGPMVVETPPMALGAFDDMWWGWIIDFGLPGPDRGEGGRFLLVPHDDNGPLPDSGYHIGHSRTTRVLMAGRSFLTNDDPAPTVETIKRTMKIYPYVPGGPGTSVATMLEGGDVHPAPPASVPDTVFVEGSGKAFNTVPPSDFGFFELMNQIVQNEPAGSTDPELMGQLAAIGIVKGQPFEPDERTRRTLEEAAAIGDATSRALFLNYRDSEGFGYYGEDSAWFNMLWVGGYTFETPPPLVTGNGIEPLPATGARTLHSRTSFLYAATVVSPAMCMRLTNIGSQYLMVVRDADGERLDGGKNYRMTLPKDIPAARFWSVTLYDNQTRSMLQTPQRFPRAGSQSYPTPAATADADGSTTLTFGPERPPDSPEGNWIQTTEGLGWFPILRLYSPLESFFDKSWQPSEIEPV